MDERTNPPRLDSDGSGFPLEIAGSNAFPASADFPSEPYSVSMTPLEDGSYQLNGRITLSVRDENGQQRTAETEKLRLVACVSGEGWDEQKPDGIDGSYKIIINNGTLSVQEDGSMLIEGDKDNPVLVSLALRDENDQAPGFIVEFNGESLLDEAETSVVAEVATIQEQLPEPEQIVVEWADGNLSLSNAITFHADRDGFHVAQQVQKLEIHNFPDGKEWADQCSGIIGDDQLVSITGGICTAQISQENETVLVIESSAENPVSISVSRADQMHERHAGVCVDYSGSLGPIPELPPPGVPLLCLGATALLSALLGAGITALLKRKRKVNPDMPTSPPTIQEEEKALHIDYGKLQQIGKRASQQDSFGLFGVSGGVFAVVADGMGGLKNGDAVSQKIVQTIEADCKRLSAAQIHGNMLAMAAHANDEVNRMLGPNELYKSGSTLVAVLAEPQQFSWVSIGDSRIYLYRAGRLLQLNREHDFEADLLLRAVNHQVSFQEAKNNPKRRSVSSFIGMGNLKYVDEMRRPIQTIRGDRILLCSDGVFNTLSEQRIEAILAKFQDPKQAAATMESSVTAANNPHQDNFTAIIISYD